ncbi:MAG: hypothetical protein AAF086_08150 [Planctomycetota bacterium]
MQKIFRRSQPVGEAFGVVLVYPEKRERGVKKASGGGGLEVATFRTEGVYSDGRHPDTVEFSDAQHDAQRRDFTINGLFEDPGELQGSVDDQRTPLPPDIQTQTLPDNSIILDHVGGLADLEAKTLRAIGDPDRRFAEDYLRMLRAVRFTTRLGFTLDPATAEAIRTHALRLDRIARERIGGELYAMFAKPGRSQAVSLLENLGLDEPVLNESHRLSSTNTLLRLPNEAHFPAVLATWMIDRHGLAVATQSRVKHWRDALCLSNNETNSLASILHQLNAAEDWPTMTTAARKRLLSRTDWDQTILVLRASGRAAAIDTDTPSLIEDGVGLAPPPFVDGADLIALQLKPGPHFKTLLDDAYDAQLEGRVQDREQALVWVRDRAVNT